MEINNKTIKLLLSISATAAARYDKRHVNLSKLTFIYFFSWNASNYKAANFRIKSAFLDFLVANEN